MWMEAEMMRRRRPDQRSAGMRICFEGNRLSAACLAEAYERLVPVRWPRRGSTTGSRSPQATSQERREA